MSLEITLTIFEILFFTAMIVLAIYLIFALKKITDSVKNIESKISEVADNLNPLISDTSEVIKDLAVISENIKQDYNKARPVVAKAINTVEDISHTLGKVKDGTTQVTKYLFPVLSGVSTALKFLRK